MAILHGCRRRDLGLTAAASVLALTATAPPAAAQAFLPRKGDGAVGIIYQNQSVEQHSLDTGEKFDAGHTRTHVVAFDFTYGVTDRLAISTTLPFVGSRYTGAGAHDFARFGRDSVLDDGAFHGTLQDFRVDVRYNAIKRGTVVTPYVTAMAPSHSYDYFGHGAPGRRLAELQVGVFVAQNLERFLPGSYGQMRYGYGIPQAVAGYRSYRSVIEGEFGYFVGRRLRVFGAVIGQVAHGGVRFETKEFFKTFSPDENIHHDRISRINGYNVAVGAQLDVSPTISLFGSVTHTQSMTNGHVLKYGVTTGMSWSFHHGPPSRVAAASQSASLAKCLCQKKQ